MNPDIIAKAKQMFSEGATYSEIGATFGVGHNTAHGWVDRAYYLRHYQRKRQRIQALKGLAQEQCDSRVSVPFVRCLERENSSIWRMVQA